jgi:cobalamin synthase
MLIGLLILILATLVAGPIGFVVAAVCLITWAIITGTLHLVIDLVLLPFRAIGALARR